jgi:GH15 family glucan-1,4-alpha-glucosidase
MSNTAIADHALLSDRHSTALVDRSGSVDWLGFPRFDSPSVFGRLLGPDAGHWSITPRRGLVQRPPLRGPDAGAGNQRDEIWETVIRQAWSKEAGAFTQYVGSTALDAANLMMAIVGFLPATDPRMLATIDAIEERLTDDRGAGVPLSHRGRSGRPRRRRGHLLALYVLARPSARAGRSG